jgi:hypothetical protein
MLQRQVRGRGSKQSHSYEGSSSKDSDVDLFPSALSSPLVLAFATAQQQQQQQQLLFGAEGGEREEEKEEAEEMPRKGAVSARPSDEPTLHASSCGRRRGSD